MTKLTADLPGASDLAMTLIEISQSVTRGAETFEVFNSLVERCVELLPVAAAGILLRDVNGVLQVIGASSPSAHLLDLFQVQNEEGPCLECCNTGVAVSDESLDAAGSWPKFAKLTRETGFSAVYALPLHSKNVVVGALNLFAEKPISEDRLLVGQALADVATMSLLQLDPQVDLQVMVRHIHIAVESKNTLEQAQGMIAQRFNLDIESAYFRIRQAADETRLPLVEVARAVVQRDENSPVAKLLSKA
ncbi:MAG: hypothetical protein RL038_1135 [Actinomycetota bacterium]|jgi:hypothetical protein